MDVEIRTIDGRAFTGDLATVDLGQFSEALSKNERGYLVIRDDSRKAIVIKKTAIASIIEK